MDLLLFLLPNRAGVCGILVIAATPTPSPSVDGVVTSGTEWNDLEFSSKRQNGRVSGSGKSALFKVAGGLAIVATFFFGTLYVLEYVDRNRSPEARLAANVRLVMDALQKYRVAKNAYPLLPNGPMTQLAAPLVDGGYLPAFPKDLGGETNRYLSDGNVYGLRVARPTGGDCLVEVGITKTEWWGLTLPCNY